MKTYNSRKTVKTVTKWQRRNKHKVYANRKINRGVRRGDILKPTHCQVCKMHKTRIEGHHEDYTRPLKVIWCCTPCHVVLDRLRRKREKEENLIGQSVAL